MEKIDAPPERIAKAICYKVDVPVLKDGKHTAKQPVKGAATKPLKQQEKDAEKRKKAEEQDKKGRTKQGVRGAQSLRSALSVRKRPG